MLRIVILIAALTAGGGAAWMALAMRGEPAAATAVAPAAPPALQDVLVAAADLGVNKRLAKDNMRWQSWPESALNPAYITRSARPDALESLVGSMVRSRMISGEPIRDANLAQLRYTVQFAKIGRMDVVDVAVENK
jgi:pilus assembly protein CpaB